MQQVRSQEWRRFGFGGPPEPWDHGALRDLDRLATSYFLDILESHRVAISVSNEDDLRKHSDDLFATATRQKHEIDYTLRQFGDTDRCACANSQVTAGAEVRFDPFAGADAGRVSLVRPRDTGLTHNANLIAAEVYGVAAPRMRQPWQRRPS